MHAEIVHFSDALGKKNNASKMKSILEILKIEKFLSHLIKK